MLYSAPVPIVNLFLCLIFKFSLTTVKYVSEKISVHRGSYAGHDFRSPVGSQGLPMQIRGTVVCRMFQSNCIVSSMGNINWAQWVIKKLRHEIGKGKGGNMG